MDLKETCNRLTYFVYICLKRLLFKGSLEYKIKLTENLREHKRTKKNKRNNKNKGKYFNRDTRCIG